MHLLQSRDPHDAPLHLDPRLADAVRSRLRIPPLSFGLSLVHVAQHRLPRHVGGRIEHVTPPRQAPAAQHVEHDAGQRVQRADAGGLAGRVAHRGLAPAERLRRCCEHRYRGAFFSLLLLVVHVALEDRTDLVHAARRSSPARSLPPRFSACAGAERSFILYFVPGQMSLYALASGRRRRRRRRRPALLLGLPLLPRPLASTLSPSSSSHLIVWVFVLSPSSLLFTFRSALPQLPLLLLFLELLPFLLAPLIYHSRLRSSLAHRVVPLSQSHPTRRERDRVARAGSEARKRSTEAARALCPEAARLGTEGQSWPKGRRRAYVAVE